MLDWNVIVTVLPGAGRDHALPARLRQYGAFQRAPFKDLFLGKVADAAGFLESLRLARESGEAWVGSLARAIPVERTFRFAPETLAGQFAQAAEAFLDRIRDGASFHVRLERRGFVGKIDSHGVELAVADHLLALAATQDKRLDVSFEDPDFIVAAETVGDVCGVALLSHELHERYPFVATR